MIAQIWQFGLMSRFNHLESSRWIIQVKETTCSWLNLGAVRYALSMKVVNTTDEKKKRIC